MRARDGAKCACRWGRDSLWRQCSADSRHAVVALRWSERAEKSSSAGTVSPAARSLLSRKRAVESSSPPAKRRVMVNPSLARKSSQKSSSLLAKKHEVASRARSNSRCDTSSMCSLAARETDPDLAIAGPRNCCCGSGSCPARASP